MPTAAMSPSGLSASACRPVAIGSVRVFLPAPEIPPGQLTVLGRGDERAIVGCESKLGDGRPEPIYAPSEAFRRDRGTDRLQGAGVSDADRGMRPGRRRLHDDELRPVIREGHASPPPPGDSASCSRVRASMRRTCCRRRRARAFARRGCTQGCRPRRDLRPARLADLLVGLGVEEEEPAGLVADGERRPVRAEGDPPEERVVRAVHDPDRSRAHAGGRRAGSRGSGASRRSRPPGGRAAASGRGPPRRAPARRGAGRAGRSRRRAPRRRRRGPRRAGRRRRCRRRRRQRGGRATPTSSPRSRRFVRRTRFVSFSEASRLSVTNSRSSSFSSKAWSVLQSRAAARRAPR